MARTYETNGAGMVTHVMEETSNDYKRLNIYKWDKKYQAWIIVPVIRLKTLQQGIRRGSHKLA